MPQDVRIAHHNWIDESGRENMKGKRENRIPKNLIEVHYYNVVIYVEIKTGEDEYLIEYLKRLVTGDGRVTLKMILNWCRRHHLNAHTKFRYRSDFPILANLINLIKYCRVLWELERDGE